VVVASPASSPKLGLSSPAPLPSDAPSAVASAAVGPDATPSPVTPIDRDRAIAIARAARRDAASEGVLRAQLGTFAELADPYAEVNPPIPGPKAVVWRVTLGWQQDPITGQGVDVLVDATTGRVLQIVDWIS
jgi:hypothetical protein